MHTGCGWQAALSTFFLHHLSVAKNMEGDVHAGVHDLQTNTGSVWQAGRTVLHFCYFTRALRPKSTIISGA
jgi:hypothetical protein